MQPTQPRSPQKIQGQDSINQLEEQAFASSLQGRSVSSGNGGSVSSNFVPKLFQATVQPPSGDSTLVAIEQLDESLDIASCRFPGLVSQSGAERSSQTVRSLKEVLPTILEGLYGDADEEQLRQEASAWGRSSATLCRYGYFLVLHEQTQDSTVALLKQAVDCREDKAWITYKPTNQDASRDLSSFISDDMITANASCLAALLLSYIFLQKGEFQKSYDWNLTVEQSAKQQPSAVHIFLRDALKKELTQAVSGTISSELQRACKGSISIVGRSLGGSSSSRDRLALTISEAQDFFPMLGDYWLAPEQQFPKDALLFIQKQISQLEAVIGDLDVNVQNQALKQLEPFYLLYGPLLKQAENGKEKNTGLVNHLLHLATYHAGEQALRADKPDVARGLFAHLMTQVHKCDNQLVERSALQLGQIYLDKGTKEDCIKAAGLFNYAHNLAKKIEPRSPAEQRQFAFFTDQCLEKIASAQTLMIRLCNGVCCPLPARLKSLDVDNRKLLSEIRASAIARIAEDQSEPRETQALFAKIAQDMKSLVAQLFQQCLDVYGPPPCQFAMITLGSLARHEATPWSDLEFAFLIEEEKDSPEVIEYFVNITYLMHLKVINLGETILPALSIPDLKIGNFYDDVTPRGFAFDGGGVAGKGHKTPLGQDEQTIEGHIVAHEFRLIQTPSQMAQFQGTSQKYDGAYWFELEPHLPLELLNIDFVCIDTQLVQDYCNPQLVEDYRKALQATLEQSYKEGLIREHLALNLLAEDDLVHFNPWSQIEVEHAGCLLRAKNDLYRLPHLALDRFAILSSIFRSSSWEKIEALEEKKIICSEGAKNLRRLLSETMRFRLSAYAKAQRQKEELNPLLDPFITDDAAHVSRYFDLNPTSLTRLKELYQILLPLYDSLKQVIISRNIKELSSQKLFADDYKSLGQISIRLRRYEEARTYFEQIPKGRETFGILMFLSYIAEETNDLKEAMEGYLEAKKILRRYPSAFDVEMCKVNVVVRLSDLYRKAGKIDKMKTVLNEYFELPEPAGVEGWSAAEKKEWLKGNLSVKYSLGALYMELEDYKQARPIFEELLLLSKNMQEFELLFKQALELNSKLGLALCEEDKGRRTQLFQEMRESCQSIYPVGHPTRAILEHSWGLILQEAGFVQEAQDHYLQELKIARWLSGDHSVQILFFIRLAEIDTLSSRFEQAEDRLQEALAIVNRAFPGRPHLLFQLYHVFACNYYNWGKMGEAEKHFCLIAAAQEGLEPRSTSNRQIIALRCRAEALIELHKFDAAQDCSLQALKAAESHYAVGPELLIQVLRTRGRCLLKAGKKDEALPFYERSLDVFYESYEKIFSVYTKTEVANSLVILGRPREAVKMLGPLSECRSLSPDDSKMILESLGYAYGAFGKERKDDESALAQYKLVLCETLGEHGHIDILCFFSSTARYLIKSKRLEEAEECIAQACGLIDSSGDSALVRLKLVLGKFIKILRDKEDFPKEAIYLLQLLRLLNRLDPNCESVITTKGRLATVCVMQRKWTEVLRYGLPALDYYLKNKIFGPYCDFMELVIMTHSAYVRSRGVEGTVTSQ